MIPAAAALLDDAAQLEAADRGGLLRQVASAAAQVRSSLAVVQEVALGELTGTGRPRAVVVTGVGLAGEVLAAVCGPGCPVQITAVHGYQLPGWVGAHDLVLAVSGAGTDTETLATAEQAMRRGCQLAAVGAPQSPLADLAERARAPFLPVRGADQVQTALWSLAVPLIGVAGRFGLCDASPAAHEAAAVVLEDLAQRCRPDSDSFVNPAKGLALDLAGTLPVIWGMSPLTGVAAHRFASQLAVSAGYPALAGLLPAARHDQAVTLAGSFAPGPAVPWTPENDGDDTEEPATPLHLVLLTDEPEPAGLAQSREWCTALAAERRVGVTELPASGDHPLARLASLIQLTDYVTVYLGLALGFDPAPAGAGA